MFTEATATTILVTGPPGTQVEMRDFDLDGDLDLFLWSDAWAGSGASILVNDGVGVFNQVVTVPGPASGAPAAIGDFNGDGLPDIAYGFVGSPT